VVVSKPVIAAADAEADDVAFIVVDLEPLGGAGSGEAGDDVDFPERPNVAISDEHVAAFDGVFVGLWVVEAADDSGDVGSGLVGVELDGFPPSGDGRRRSGGSGDGVDEVADDAFVIVRPGAVQDDVYGDVGGENGAMWYRSLTNSDEPSYFFEAPNCWSSVALFFW